MKQADDKTKEEMINNLYGGTILKSKSKSMIKQLPNSKKHGEQSNKQSPRKLDDVVYSLKNTPRDSHASSEGNKPNKDAKDITDKYLQQGNDSHGVCMSRKCSLREISDQLHQRQQKDRMHKIQRMLKQQLKKKQLIKHWDTQRKASITRNLDEKIRVKMDLKERQKQWKAQIKLSEQIKHQQREFRHIINMEKIDMLRRSRQKLKITENQHIKEREKESWRDMKFKEHNTQRLMSSRKNHELDPLRLYRSQTARPKSSKNNINKH